MNYLQAVEYIESLGVFGIKAGLERIEYLLDQLGQPQERIKCIHVAGTNGKGSVCSMLEAMLAEYTTGKFTSPHLVSYNERFSLNGSPITDQDFADLVGKIRPIVDTMPADLRPTQFELLTAMAFEYFAAKQVDYAIIEVGLGGLLDSTNVITPLVSVITNVDMDHMDKCGNTLAEIAAHKAGIIKAEVPVVTAAGGEALKVVKARATELNCKCLIYGEQFAATSIRAAIPEDLTQQFAYIYMEQELRGSLRLIGAHQLLNAAVAITAVVEILGWERAGLAAQKIVNSRWAGRLELVASNPTVILDGAHNLAGAKVLRDTLDSVFSDRPICFILGFMQDKDIHGIVDILLKPKDWVIPVVADPDYPRSATVEYIKKFLPLGQLPTGAEQELTYTQALQKARECVGTEGVICIAGSLYLIGRIKQENIV